MICIKFCLIEKTVIFCWFELATSKTYDKTDKDDELYREMCRVVGKVVLEMRDLGQEPKYIVIAGVLRTALANQRIQRSALEKQAMETVINALARS